MSAADVDIFNDNGGDDDSLLTAEGDGGRRSRVIAGRPLMSLSTRRTLSFMHMASFASFSAAAIISLYDGVSQGSDPEDYTYDVEAQAAAAGVSASIGDINKYVYLALLVFAALAALLSVLWEWMVYRGTSFMGLDLTFNNVDTWSVRTATEQARKSFSPRGESYRTYLLATWYAYWTTLALYIFHITYEERAVNRFSMVLVPIWVILLCFLLVSLYKTYYEEVSVECVDFVLTPDQSRAATQNLRRYARRRGLI